MFELRTSKSALARRNKILSVFSKMKEEMVKLNGEIKQRKQDIEKEIRLLDVEGTRLSNIEQENKIFLDKMKEFLPKS